MIQSSSPLSSSIPPSSSVSFFEKYEKMFHCGGCIVDDEHEPVASAILYQQSRYGNEERNQTTEAISNWSSYIRERRQQESTPPMGTVLLNQTTSSYDEIDKFDIDERASKRQQSKTKAAKGKAQTEEGAVNEFFNGIRNSHQPEIQMVIQISPTTIMTQQQQQRQQQQHCHATPLKYSKTSTRKSTCSSSSSPKSTTKRLHYDMLKDMLLANNQYRSSKSNSRYLNSNSLTQTDSESTQSTQSLSESEDDLSWGPIDEEQQPPQPQEQEQDTLVSILRRKVKLGIMTDTNNTIANTDNRVRVRFDKNTKFLDPNERPSSTRKHVPRMSSRQKQEYQLNNYYQPTTVRRRQLDLSSLLMAAAAAGPSPLMIAPTKNNDEFRDSSMTATKNRPTNMCSSHQNRLARRAQQNQYHPHHQRSHSSATAEELLLSHYYSPNNQ